MLNCTSHELKFRTVEDGRQEARYTLEPSGLFVRAQQQEEIIETFHSPKSGITINDYAVTYGEAVVHRIPGAAIDDDELDFAIDDGGVLIFVSGIAYRAMVAMGTNCSMVRSVHGVSRDGTVYARGCVRPS